MKTPQRRVFAVLSTAQVLHLRRANRTIRAQSSRAMATPGPRPTERAPTRETAVGGLLEWVTADTPWFVYAISTAPPQLRFMQSDCPFVHSWCFLPQSPLPNLPSQTSAVVPGV